jgi:hypothetical protein
MKMLPEIIVKFIKTQLCTDDDMNINLLKPSGNFTYHQV